MYVSGGDPQPTVQYVNQSAQPEWGGHAGARSRWDTETPSS